MIDEPFAGSNSAVAWMCSVSVDAGVAPEVGRFSSFGSTLSA
jgi:hypothetical protein